jgi:hypothetical protein
MAKKKSEEATDASLEQADIVTNETVTETENEIVVTTESIVPNDTEEVEFLKRIYRIQNDGGFGTHLNGEIEERIKKLQGK